MKRFTDAGRQAIDAGNLYAGLSLALMMPDICASIEDPGPGKSQKRYETWFRKWAEPKFTAEIGVERTKRVFVSAEDCYQLRCSLIHSGRADIDPKKVTNLHRFEFFDDTVGSHLNMFGSVVINAKEVGNFLQLKADAFSRTMFEAADEWDQATQKEPAVQHGKTGLLTIRTKGFVAGGPGGIAFG